MFLQYLAGAHLSHSNNKTDNIAHKWMETLECDWEWGPRGWVLDLERRPAEFGKATLESSKSDGWSEKVAISNTLGLWIVPHGGSVG